MSNTGSPQATALGRWHVSSYSANGGECVEVFIGNGAVAVRDTKNRDGGSLAFSNAAWAAFTAALTR